MSVHGNNYNLEPRMSHSSGEVHGGKSTHAIVVPVILCSSHMGAFQRPAEFGNGAYVQQWIVNMVA